MLPDYDPTRSEVPTALKVRRYYIVVDVPLAHAYNEDVPGDDEFIDHIDYLFQESDAIPVFGFARLNGSSEIVEVPPL